MKLVENKTPLTVPVRVCLGPDQIKRIDECSKDERLYNRSALIRRIIDEFFAGRKNSSTEQEAA